MGTNVTYQLTSELEMIMVSGPRLLLILPSAFKDLE